MAFNAFGSISDVALAYQIICTEAEFVSPIPMRVTDQFRSELDFTLTEVDYTNAEFSACENLIYPVLREVWKGHLKPLMLRGHQPLNCDEMLCGVIDYYATRRSPLGKVVRGSPYVLLVIEAKRDDFEHGWGQCLAGMVAAQRLNKDAEQVLYGIVTNGQNWTFGKLSDSTFTYHRGSWSIFELDALLGAVNYIFTQCSEAVTRQQAVA